MVFGSLVVVSILRWTLSPLGSYVERVEILHGDHLSSRTEPKSRFKQKREKTDKEFVFLWGESSYVVS